MLRAAIDGIKARGKSDVGDKTLLDALVPAVDAIEERVTNGESAAAALKAAALVAREQAEATRGMLAKRGRAAYTGERSIGTLDAGAVAVAVMFEALADEWAKRPPGRSVAKPSRTANRDQRRHVVKKFVNDPKLYVPEMLKGIALANPDTLRYVPEYNLIMRTDAPNPDKVSVDPGLRLGTRARARDDRRPGNARRRLPR